MREQAETRKQYWDKIYSLRPTEEMGWHQIIPEISLSFVRSAGLPKNISIIDIGAGESSLAGHLIEFGSSRLTILDVSEKAVQRSRDQLKDYASKIRWISTDILEFVPDQQYDLWHDRACFHFLISEEDVSKYVEITRKAVVPGGYLIVGTFSLQGPMKCSGLPVRRYDHRLLQKTFIGFKLETFQYLDHITPAGKLQNYIFCLFKAED